MFTGSLSPFAPLPSDARATRLGVLGTYIWRTESAACRVQRAAGQKCRDKDKEGGKVRPQHPVETPLISTFRSDRTSHSIPSLAPVIIPSLL